MSIPLAAGAARGRAPRTSFDVIIAGGGFAGVTAARELGRAGYRCLILEARGRLGGRTFSTTVFDQPGEVGGQWIHWLQPHAWAEVTRYGLSLYETPGAASPATVGVLSDRGLERQEPGRNFEMLQSAMRHVCAESRTLFPRPFDPRLRPELRDLDRLSVQDRLDGLDFDPMTRAAVTAYLTTNANAAPRDVGLLDQIHWYARAGHDMERLLQACAQFKLTEGTAFLLSRMLADSRAVVELNQPVTVVESDTSGVTVTTDDGRVFRSKAMVVALPMNCWTDVEWRPGIDAKKLEASRRRHAGSGFELHVLLEGNAGSYLAMAPTPSPISLLYTDQIGPSGTVMVGLGPTVADFDLNDDAAVADAVRRLMPEARVLRSFAYDWNADPYSKGTWCNYRPGMWTTSGAAMRQREGRIVFSGADIADGWRGFIDGAIESGLRAAREAAAIVK